MPYITHDQLTAFNQRLAAVERRQRSGRVAVAVVLVAAAGGMAHQQPPGSNGGAPFDAIRFRPSMNSSMSL